MTAFVTDGNQRASLAVVRALGRAGIPVVVGEAETRSLAGSSRFCTKTITYPKPETDKEGFLQRVIEELKNPSYRVVIPITDITLRLLSSVRSTLPPGIRIPFPSSAHIERAQDKRQVLLLAQQLGIPCPKTHILPEGENLQELPEGISFPAVVKPRVSRFFRCGRWVSAPVQYALDPESLIEIFRKVHSQIPDPLVQEKLEGDGRGVFLLVWNDELKAAFCHRRLREKPPSGGVSVYSESVRLDEKLVEKSLALLRALEWQGVAMVEFKTDRRDGQAKLMEVNGRFWGSLQLAIDAGMNFPLILYRLATGENVVPRLDYKIGIRTRWLLGDLDHLWIRLAHPDSSIELPEKRVSRLRACLQFMDFFERGTRQEVFRWDDPSPGWFELRQYLRQAFRRTREIPVQASA